MTSRWWHPHHHADRRPSLLARGRIKAAIRTWFEAQGFIEVDPGCLQASPGNEAHLHAFRTERIGTGGERSMLYLHTSPEFTMKKLLAAGEEQLFAFSPVFRNREHGAMHASEFTMLEWYRAGAPYETMMEDAVHIVKLASQTTGDQLFSWRGATANPRVEAEQVTVAAAFGRHSSINLLATISDRGEADRALLAEMAEAAGITPREHDNWSDIFSRVLTALIEPNLGLGRPTLLTEYPACEAALARCKASDPRVSERFELYCCGVELANGFGELTDAAEQRRRFEAEMAEKERIYGERYPIDEDFLAALEHMPRASGCALGFDRLVMLATGATHIDKVLWTPLCFAETRRVPSPHLTGKLWEVRGIMTQSLSGGCQCGAIRYRIDRGFGRAGICHCRMCQKAFGSWGAALVSVPEKNLTWMRGTPGEFRSSAIVARGFCTNCGTPLFMREDGDVNYEIAIGSLDDPNAVAPLTEQSGVESKLVWFDRMHALPAQHTTDYRTPEDMARLKSLQHPDYDMLEWPPKE